MTSPTLARLRLYTQRITGPAFADPAEVVRWLGAMQAQDYQQALWAIGVRTQGARWPMSSGLWKKGESSAPGPCAARSTSCRRRTRAGCSC